MKQIYILPICAVTADAGSFETLSSVLFSDTATTRAATDDVRENRVRQANITPPCGLRAVSVACLRQSRLQATARAPSKAIVTEHHGVKSPRAYRRRSEMI